MSSNKKVKSCTKGCLKTLITIIIIVAVALPLGFIISFPKRGNEGDILFEGGAFATSDGSHWSLGFAKEIISPQNVDTNIYYMAGFNNNNRVTGILDDTYARAVVLNDNSDRDDMGSVALVALDIIGLSRKNVQDIRSSLLEYCEANNISTVNVMSIHNHSSVDTQGLWGKNYVSSGINKDYMVYLKEQAKKAVIAANENKTDGTLSLGTIKVGEDLIHDRRTPNVYDDNLVRLAFRPDNNTLPNTYIINFGMHVEGLAQVNSESSADWIKPMGDVISEQDPNSDFIFINGAIGGLITVPCLDEVYKSGDVSFAKAETIKYGRAIGELVMAIDNEEDLSPRLNFIAKKIYIPIPNIGFVIFKLFGVIDNDVLRKGAGFEIATEISYMELGSGANMLKTLFVPGEIFPELALGGYLSEVESPLGKGNPYNGAHFYEMMGEGGVKSVFGLANDQLGYIIPENDYLLHDKLPYVNYAFDQFNREHYEEGVSTGVKTAGILLEEVQAMINAAKQ